MIARSMHYKSTAMTTDGAACGRRNVAFTARESDVTCVRCRERIHKAVAKGNVVTRRKAKR